MAAHDHPDHNRSRSRSSRHHAYGIGVVLLGALALVLILVGLDVALIAATRAPAPAQAKRLMVAVPVQAPAVSSLDLSVSPAIKPGPDGQLHDAFSITDFHVRAGQPVTLRVNNTDSMDHSITAPEAGVSIIVKPGKHTYTLLVTKPGRFLWYCIYPCDPWSMQHDGYMRGSITAT